MEGHVLGFGRLSGTFSRPDRSPPSWMASTDGGGPRGSIPGETPAGIPVSPAPEDLSPREGPPSRGSGHKVPRGFAAAIVRKGRLPAATVRVPGSAVAGSKEWAMKTPTLAVASLIGAPLAAGPAAAIF
jgi:hypothetical protein